MKKHIETEDLSLEQYLDINRRYSIPYSQRPYEWKKPQIKRLFNDLVALNHDDDDVHMLNFFTLSGEAETSAIFDGQQRTITILLLVGIFAQKFYALGSNCLAKEIFNNYIDKKSELNGKELKKVTFDASLKNAEDYLYKLLIYTNQYKDQVITNNINDPLANHLINKFKENYDYLTELFNNYLADNDLDNEEKIKKLFLNIIKKTELIIIKTDTDDLAMRMFETLNNTGKKLMNFYVLKNDLIIALGETTVHDPWDELETNLDGINHNQFLKTFVTVKAGKITDSNLLQKLYLAVNNNEKLTDETKAQQLLNDLNSAAQKYRFIINSNTYFNDKDNDNEAITNYHELSKDINLFGLKQHEAVILAMFMQNYALADINKILRTVLRIAISNLYFSNHRANKFEAPFAKLSNEIYLNKITVNEIQEQLNKVLVADEQLVSTIENFTITGNATKKIKFILRETYNADLTETKIKESYANIQYEHILPQNPQEDSQWSQLFTPEEHDRYVGRIGNATLLLGKTNNTIKNKDFETKKLEYQKSEIPDNHEIAIYSQWDKKAIEQRSKALAQRIIKYLNSLS